MREFVVPSFVILVACGSGAEIGSPCKTYLSTDECESGAICVFQPACPTGVYCVPATKLVCSKLCDSQADCPAATSCVNHSAGSVVTPEWCEINK